MAARYWWVSQNRTFRLEREGGYLWAPRQDSRGNTPFFWSNMQRVRPGDIVYSYFRQTVCAVGVVTSRVYNSRRPVAFDDLWEASGWRVELEYRDVNPAKPIADFVHELSPLLPKKYSPLDCNGKGRMGYLFELPDRAGLCVAKAISGALRA